jgi:hypothetical protein
VNISDDFMYCLAFKALRLAINKVESTRTREAIEKLSLGKTLTVRDPGVRSL